MYHQFCFCDKLTLKLDLKFSIPPENILLTMSRKKVLDLSFAGCGFLTMYHIGSLAAFRRASDSVIINRCLGASGGALVACAAVADLDSLWLEAVFRDLVKSVGQNRFGAFSRNFDVSDILKV